MYVCMSVHVRVCVWFVLAKVVAILLRLVSNSRAEVILPPQPPYSSNWGSKYTLSCLIYSKNFMETQWQIESWPVYLTVGKTGLTPLFLCFCSPYMYLTVSVYAYISTVVEAHRTLGPILIAFAFCPRASQIQQDSVVDPGYSLDQWTTWYKVSKDNKTWTTSLVNLIQLAFIEHSS